MRSAGLEQLDRAAAVASAQLVHDRRDVTPDGHFRDPKPLSDLRGRLFAAHALENFEFTRSSVTGLPGDHDLLATGASPILELGDQP